MHHQRSGLVPPNSRYSNLDPRAEFLQHLLGIEPMSVEVHQIQKCYHAKCNGGKSGLVEGLNHEGKSHFNQGNSSVTKASSSEEFWGWVHHNLPNALLRD